MVFNILTVMVAVLLSVASLSVKVSRESRRRRLFWRARPSHRIRTCNQLLITFSTMTS